jgi:hypothetical protein
MINQSPVAITTHPFDTRRGELVIPKQQQVAAQAEQATPGR